MREKIQNALLIEITGSDLSKATKIEFWIRNGTRFLQYAPTVVDATHLLVVIPYKDAMGLDASKGVLMQAAFTDANGNPIATDIVRDTVTELLKESGYD